MGFELIQIYDFMDIGGIYEMWFDISYNERIHTSGYQESFWLGNFKLNVYGGAYDYNQGELRMIYCSAKGG